MKLLTIAGLLTLLPMLSWAGGSGKFSVETTPSGMVIVDDIPVKQSPLHNLVLPEGSHKFEYQLSPGKSEEFHLTIVADQQLLCTYNFETSTHRCGIKNLKPVKGVGSFEATSNLPAEVTLDGKPIGKTPIAKTKVSLGKHQLEFKHGNLEKVIRDIEVNANEHVEVEANFEIKTVPTEK